MSRYYTVAEIAEMCGVSQDKPRDWIADGSLAAINVARHSGGRARWRIAADDLERFIAGRRSQPPAPALKRKRRQPGTVTQYY